MSLVQPRRPHNLRTGERWGGVCRSRLDAGLLVDTLFLFLFRGIVGGAEVSYMCVGVGL